MGMSSNDMSAQALAARKARRWSQQEVADRAGVSLRAYQMFETRQSTPQPNNLRKILEALDIEQGDQVAAETRAEWPPEVQVFLDVMGAYLMTMPESARLETIHGITRQIFGRE